MPGQLTARVRFRTDAKLVYQREQATMPQRVTLPASVEPHYYGPQPRSAQHLQAV